jgi:glyoxylase-like metal-dependent hydrolase (beta-lactamase superfamily II)
MLHWTIGQVRVTRIVELESTGGSRFILPDATPEACQPMKWMQPHFCSPEGKLRMSVHALVIDTGSRRIVVDTCIGNDKPRAIPAWNRLQTRFLDEMAAAGYPRESIDTVLCTHLHVDHVGWNTLWTGEQWVPTFPNARYLVHAKEWAYWNAEAADEQRQILDDSVQPVVDAGLMDQVATDHAVCDEVRLEPTPGHTPGHVSVRITSQGQQALITGDFMHHPCQMEHLDWGSTADWDKPAAKATRERMMTSLAADQTLVIGTHFATPTAGRVKPNPDGGWWLDVALG